MAINYLRLMFENHILNFRLRFIFSNILILFFIAFTLSASWSIRKFVNSTLSITLVTPRSAENSDSPLSTEDMNSDSTIVVKVKKGDTLNSILQAQTVAKEEIAEILNTPEIVKLANKLKIGQTITFDYDLKIVEANDNELTNEIKNLSKIVWKIDQLNSLQLVKENGKFLAKNTTLVLNKVVKKSHAVINSNFVSALKSMGLSSNSIIELVNAYNHQLDFQRQIKPNDTITVITEKFYTPKGEFVQHGRILYASLKTSGKEYNIYRYANVDTDKEERFYSEDGKSVERSLLRNPLKLIRITSKFGNRRHPISGYNKVHTGIDFAAPVGTPIYAAGDGVITEAGRKGGYGNFVQIKHSPTLSTAYGHLSKFAANLKHGIKVKQGQVIGYVGNTGRSTGPHLHWEVKVEGRHVNPLSVKTTPQTVLSGAQLKKFESFKHNFKELNEKLLAESLVLVNNS